MQEPRRFGFVDESYGRDGDGFFVHVLGLIEVRADVIDEVRAVLLDLPRTRGGVLHFVNEDRSRRTAIAKVIGELPVRRTAIVTRGNDSESRARAVGLSTIVWARGTALDLLVIESRGTKLDSGDAEVLAKTHPPAGFEVRFLGKRADPILWAADTVASATFQALTREVPDHLLALGHVDQQEC
jgi:hypothetical protein